MDSMRVVICDDHMVVRAGLKAMFDSTADIRVIAEVSNGSDAVSYTERLRPDVVVMDVSMPRMDGIAATKEILARIPSTRVLILTVHEEEELLVPAMDAGASGYLVKSRADRDVIDAVRSIARTGRYLRPGAERRRRR